MAEHSKNDLPKKRHAAQGSAVQDIPAAADSHGDVSDGSTSVRTNLPRFARSAAIHTSLPETAPESGSDSADETATGEFPAVSAAAAAADSSSAASKARPRTARSHSRRAKIATNAMVLLLCALLGFGYVTQQRSIQTSYSSLSEAELVRLLDETNQEVGQLEARKTKLEQQLQSIQNAADKQAEAQKVAKENEESAGILAGRLPATGPGVTISITAGSKRIDAATMFNLIEELRNAGAEVMEVNGVRIVTSSYFTDTASGVNCDGTNIRAPYTVNAIGDASALENAVDIAGGVGSRLRVQYGANVSIERKDSIVISKLAAQRSYKYATPVK